MSIVNFRVVLLPALFLIFLTACTGSNDEKTTSKSRSVNLAIWGNYLSPEMIEKFTKETGIQVNISNYTSNEELLAKVQAGGGGIDVAVPSDYMVSIMAKLELLEPLDKTAIPNASQLAKNCRHCRSSRSFQRIDKKLEGRFYEP